MNIKLKLKPFTTPSFVLAERPPGPRVAGFQEAPSFPLSEVGGPCAFRDVRRVSGGGVSEGWKERKTRDCSMETLPREACVSPDGRTQAPIVRYDGPKPTAEEIAELRFRKRIERDFREVALAGLPAAEAYRPAPLRIPR